MIYLNLLILEASLRAQYLELRARRRHHSFFLVLLTLWTIGFGWALFLAPREDGRGLGGSVYWMVESTERICFLGGVMTAVLVLPVGIWERGVRWPRRWFAVSNRGLRNFNCKLVVVKRPWWRESLSVIGFFLTYGLFSHTGGSSYRYVEPAVLREIDREMRQSGPNQPTLPLLNEDEERRGQEEDLAPGGDYVKLLLLPKPFSPTFRENWELYRTEYWERENERRALLRLKMRERDEKLRKQTGSWFWWLPWRRVRGERLVHASEKFQPQHRQHAVLAAEHKRPRSSSAGGRVRRGSNASSPPSSTRSPTPPVELVVEETAEGVSRRSSTASNASDKRRKKKKHGSVRGNRPRNESRSVTPDTPSPLAMTLAAPGDSADST